MLHFRHYFLTVTISEPKKTPLLMKLIAEGIR